MRRPFRWFTVTMVLASSLALGAQGAATSGGPTSGISGLIAKLRQAYGDIQKARSALSSKPSKTASAQGSLSRAEQGLGSVRSALPSSALLSKVEQAQTSLQSGGSASGTGGGAASSIGGLAQEAAKVDPNLASSLGQAQQHAQAGNTAQASTQLDTARQQLKSNPIESAYDKVTGAQTALKGGKTSTAQQLLAHVPSLSSLESSLLHGLGGSAVGGSGPAAAPANTGAAGSTPAGG